jgi:ligand-binding sensor domain-containing protein
MPQRTTAEWYADGLSLLESGFFGSAIECFDRVLQAQPRHSRAWVLKASALLGMESYQEALECLDQALDIDPRDVQAWQEKATCLSARGEEDEAVECRRRAESMARSAQQVVVGERQLLARTYGTADGLRSASITALAADEEEAWFAYGSSEGVTRLTLDDSRFRTYTEDDGLTSNVVRCILLTDEHVWLGTDQGVSRFDREVQRWTRFTEDTGLKASVVNDIVPDGDLLWLGTDSGLVVLDPTTGRSVICSGGPDPRKIDHLLGDGDRIWCGTRDEHAGLSVFDKTTETFVELDAGPCVEGVLLFPGSDAEKLWVATRDGVTTVDRATYDIEVIPAPTMLVTGMAAGMARLLLGTDRGLAVVDAHEGEWQVKMTDVGRGQYVTAVCGTRTREWVAIDGEGVLCLTYS